jgi:hypothetical protein
MAAMGSSALSRLPDEFERIVWSLLNCRDRIACRINRLRSYCRASVRGGSHRSKRDGTYRSFGCFSSLVWWRRFLLWTPISLLWWWTRHAAADRRCGPSIQGQGLIARETQWNRTARHPNRCDRTLCIPLSLITPFSIDDVAQRFAVAISTRKETLQFEFNGAASGRRLQSTVRSGSTSG